MLQVHNISAHDEVNLVVRCRRPMLHSLLHLVLTHLLRIRAFIVHVRHAEQQQRQQRQRQQRQRRQDSIYPPLAKWLVESSTAAGDVGAQACRRDCKRSCGGRLVDEGWKERRRKGLGGRRGGGGGRRSGGGGGRGEGGGGGGGRGRFILTKSDSFSEECLDRDVLLHIRKTRKLDAHWATSLRRQSIRSAGPGKKPLVF
eukprot:GHVS01061836.1.p1 GENE.GHVS01061836.1~~GHVS01061836.1.p1  ORF type:complete len:200 (+),score=72.45 GHVS01061836.1:412-1011(+)